MVSGYPSRYGMSLRCWVALSAIRVPPEYVKQPLRERHDFFTDKHGILKHGIYLVVPKASPKSWNRFLLLTFTD